MTRINCAIPVDKLSGPHLLAEHREIKRIPNCIKSGRYNMNGIPEKFTLGKGHVKFFYNKLEYLRNRYLKLYNECLKRNYNITPYHDSFKELPPTLFNDYEETTKDYEILKERLLEKDLNHYKNIL